MNHFTFCSLLCVVIVTQTLFVIGLSNTCGPSTCLNYGEEYSFSLDGPISPSAQFEAGKVSIGTQFELSFDLLVNSLDITGNYRSILNVGNNDVPRIPGFWLHPNDNRLAIRMSNAGTTAANRNYDSDFELEIGVLYKIVVQVCDGKVSAYINNELIQTRSGLTTRTGDDQSIFISRQLVDSGNRIYNPAQVTISNFKIQPCLTTISTSQPTSSPTQMIPSTCGPSTCLNYGNEYSFSLSGPISPSYQYEVGKVSIGTQFEVSFDLIVNSLATTGNYRSILNVGNNDVPRIPGFWLNPNDNRLAIRMSNVGTVAANRNYDSDFELGIGVLYKIVVQVCDGTVSAYINNELIQTRSDLTTRTGIDQSIFISRQLGNSGNRAYDRAQVTISNLEIRPCLTMSLTSQPSSYPSSSPTAPTLSPTQSCSYTHECSAWGDPHITTLDGTFYNFQGEGYFDYISDDCGGNSYSSLYLPFTVSARHDYCNNANTVTCVKEVLVHLKDNSNTLISFPSSGNPVYKTSGNDARGSTLFIDNNNNIVSYDISTGKFEINFIYNNEKVMLSFNYHGTRLSIKTTDCLYNSGFCGLCGKFNGDNTDDFTTCDDGTQISTNRNDYNSWENIHLFGESCCNEEYDLQYLYNTDCGSNPSPPPKPDEECMDENGYANQICQEFYNLYCVSCDDNNFINNEWLEGCVYDFCSLEDCVDITEIEEAISTGCLSTSFNECMNSKYPAELLDQM